MIIHRELSLDVRSGLLGGQSEGGGSCCDFVWVTRLSDHPLMLLTIPLGADFDLEGEERPGRRVFIDDYA